MSCNIILNNFEGVYLAGSTISGKVVCTFAETKQIRGIGLKLRGQEHTSWSKKDKRHIGRNEFLAYDVILSGEGTLDVGRYEYPFIFTLPRNLPDTFEGFHGYIRYYIKANVNLPFALDYEETKYFNVNSPIDLNDIQSELQLLPFSYQDEKTLCCFCCANGTITLDVHLQKGAFVIGELAKIKIHVKNLSNKSIPYISLNLTRTIKYSTSSSGFTNKSTTELLASTSHNGVGAHEDKFYELDFIMTPSRKIYNFHESTLIKQRIFLQVEAVIRGFHVNMRVEAGLVLGHIPLRSPSFEQSPHHFPAIQDDHGQPPPYYTLEKTHYPNPDISSAKATLPAEDIPSTPTKAEISRC